MIRSFLIMLSIIVTVGSCISKTRPIGVSCVYPCHCHEGRFRTFRGEDPFPQYERYDASKESKGNWRLKCVVFSSTSGRFPACGRLEQDLSRLKSTGWTFGADDRSHFRVLHWEDDPKAFEVNNVRNLPTAIFYVDDREHSRMINPSRTQLTDTWVRLNDTLKEK